MSTQCIYCEATQNLNTELSFALEDNSKVTVVVCDTHAEEATPKSARIAYLERQKKIEVLLEQAKALGLNITGLQQQGALLVPQVAPTRAVPQSQAAPVVVEELQGENVISTTIIDSRKGMVSVGGTSMIGGMGQTVAVQSLHSHDTSGLQSKLPAEVLIGRAKMAVVEAREGMPIAIQETRRDGTGTTRIRIDKRETDAKLQNRFKRMADDSVRRDICPDFARSGYTNTQTTCPLCHGECNVPQVVQGVRQVIVCPKCGGTGLIPL